MKYIVYDPTFYRSKNRYNYRTLQKQDFNHFKRNEYIFVLVRAKNIRKIFLQDNNGVCKIWLLIPANLVVSAHNCF